MKKALTIGELLITMGIIGVIAMLTLPGFIQDYHKRVYTTKLKKTVEMIENAVNQACIDNNVSYFYQTPYVKVATAEANKNFLRKYFKLASTQTTKPFASTYRTLNSNEDRALGLNDSSHAYAKLVGGEAVSFLCFNSPSLACVFRVDINSTDGPNIGGRDFFSIYINPMTNELYDTGNPALCGGKAKTNDEKVDAANNARAEYGEGCFARLLQDNWEMNY